MSVNLRVTGIDGASIQNLTIIVSEAFAVSSFTVDSPFSQGDETYFRGDGSAGG